ncbi:MAG: nucleoside 2-deoxyribosyltransferase [Chloroflexi bacterium]|nr:nucleoside 2-deoxyribosyltransferase [Chloroflexota bacterium]
MIEPNFERIRAMLLRRGEPDRVPLADISVHNLHKEAILGRPLKTLADEVEFWRVAGYDWVPLHQGLQETPLIKKQAMHSIEANYAADTSDNQERQWATGAKSIVLTGRDLDALDWPDPDNLDYSQFSQLGSLLPANMGGVAVLGKIFSSVWWLMGLEGLSMALVDEPDLVPRLFQKVGEFQTRVLENMLSFDAVKVVWHADDIAYKNQPMISPRLLRAHLFPWYVKMNRLTHDKGRIVVYHSDGALQQVMEDIVAAGFDGLNPIEPPAMDINWVKKEYGKHLAIMGNIDLGYTLTRGTPDEVRAEVRQRIHDLAPGGGYGLASSNSVPEYVPLANYNAMREATFEYGRYPITV